MNSYETVNNILVKMFKDILDIEERALITSEYKDISVNDMHIMEAIGIQEPKNMSTVAKAVSVTTGTLTIAINHLVKIHLCGILLDILLLQLLLEISNGISKYITSAAIFTDRTLRLFKFFLEDSDASLQFFNLTSSSEQITVIFERTTCHGTARA